MRASLKSALVAALAVVSLGVGASSAQAYYPWPHHHYGHFWGPAAVIGVFGAAAVAGSCIRNQPIYDAYGNYVGRRTVNVCY